MTPYHIHHTNKTCDTLSFQTSFSGIFDGASVLFAISTIPDGVYLQVNDTFLKTLGFNHQEIINHSSLALDLWQDSGERTRVVSYLRQHGSFQNEQVSIRKKNGEIFIGLFSGVILEIGDEHLLFTFAANADQQKDAETSLAQAMALLEKTVTKQKPLIAEELEERRRIQADLRACKELFVDRNRQHIMGQMIENILCQWRQPLHSLELLIQSISMENGETKGFSRQQVDNARHLVSYVSEAAASLRSFMKQHQEHAEFNLNDTIAQAIHLYQMTKHASDIPVIYENPSLSLVCIGKSNQCCQAIINVLINAKEVVIDREIANPHIVLEVTTTYTEAVITITDNAGGIDEELLPHIFDSCFAKKSLACERGIGLCTTRTIIEESLGGKVSVGNIPGGAQIRLAVPCIIGV